MQRISLKRLRPKINLSPATRKLFTWKELKAPLSVTFAALLGMVAAMLVDYYQPRWEYQIKTAAVISTTLLIMGEMGTSEKFYLKTTLRVTGVVTGIALGILYATFERVLQRWLGIDDPKMEATHPQAWVMLVFRVAIVSPTIFVCCVLMKVFNKYAYAINVLAIHCPTALLAKSYEASLGITMAAILAVVASAVSLLLFDKFTTESLLMDTNKKCIVGVLSVFQLAVSGDPENLEQFLTHTDAIHKSITSAESAHDTYAQWRQWTCRKVVHDFKALVKPTRPLFYQAYSLYWGNVAAYHATEYRAVILFCNDFESYERHFKALVDDVLICIERSKEDLGKLFDSPNMKEEEMDILFNQIIVNHVWHGLLRAQEDMKRQYMKNRKAIFSTFGQRWNMTDYLRQIAMMTLAMVDYMRAMIDVFQTPARRARLTKLLDEVAQALDDLRREEESSAMFKLGGSKKELGPVTLYKSTSSPTLRVDPPGEERSIGSPSHFEDDATEASPLIRHHDHSPRN